MKKKVLVGGSIFSVFILMMLPSVSAIEFNTILEKRKAIFSDKIDNLNNFIEKIKGVSSLRTKQNFRIEINELKQILSDHYIDVPAIIIILLSTLSTIFSGHVSIVYIVGTALLLWGVIYEYVIGEEFPCPNKTLTLFASIYNFLVTLVAYAVVQNDFVSYVIVIVAVLFYYVFLLPYLLKNQNPSSA